MRAQNSSSSATFTAFPEGCRPQTAEVKARAVEDCSRIRVLSISPNLEDHAALRRVLEGLTCEISTAVNCRQAAAQLSREQISVVFCESLLEDGTWERVLDLIRMDSNPPFLIVASRQADEQLWAEVLNLGGYDVVAKPLSPREVRHILTAASLWPMHSAPEQTAAAG
jgi:CheY-like chemotaxis protein